MTFSPLLFNKLLANKCRSRLDVSWNITTVINHILNASTINTWTTLRLERFRSKLSVDRVNELLWLLRSSKISKFWSGLLFNTLQNLLLYCLFFWAKLGMNISEVPADLTGMFSLLLGLLDDASTKNAS